MREAVGRNYNPAAMNDDSKALAIAQLHDARARITAALRLDAGADAVSAALILYVARSVSDIADLVEVMTTPML